MSDGTAPPAHSHIALIPGEEVPLMPLDLPKGLRGAAMVRVARRQVHDMLACDDGSDEVRPYLRKGAATTSALVVGRDPAARIAVVSTSHTQAVVPDYLAVPAAERVWTFDVDVDVDGTTDFAGARVLARLGVADGFAAEPMLAAALVAAALKDGGAPDAVLCLAPLPDAVRAALAAHDIAMVDDAAELPAGVARPAMFAHGELGLDLLRDGDTDRARLAGQLRRWRMPAGFAALAILCWCGAILTATRTVQDEQQRYQAAAVALARQGLVPTGPILDLRTQVARAVQDRQGAGVETGPVTTPLDLFARAAPLLPPARIDQVRFRNAMNAGVSTGANATAGLSVDLSVPSFADLDAVLARLSEADIAAGIAQSAAGDVLGDDGQLTSGVVATLVVSP